MGYALIIQIRKLLDENGGKDISIIAKIENHANGAKTIIFDANGEYPIAFGENSGHSAKTDKI